MYFQCFLLHQGARHAIHIQLARCRSIKTVHHLVVGHEHGVCRIHIVDGDGSGDVETLVGLVLSILVRITGVCGSADCDASDGESALAFDKDADVAIFLNPKNSFTPYVGAKFVRFGSWGSGHYFKTLQEACDWFDKEIGGEDLTEKENKTRADICITNENENGTGEYFSYKKSAMDRLSNMIDEVLAENPNAEIDIAIEYDA